MEDQSGPLPGAEALIERVRTLRDEDRVVLARARAAIDETFHEGARRAANEIVATRAEAYVLAWVRIGSAHLPDRLEDLVRLGSRADPAELAEWQGVARLTRAAIDDALVGLIAADTIRPPDLRELVGPWKEMLEAAHERGGAETAATGG